MFEVETLLPIQPLEFWLDATLADVNAELAPWVRMTAPLEWHKRPLREWPSGRTLFKSWVLLFGVLPVDIHGFFLQSIDPQRGFEERSSSVTNKRWNHTRRVEPSTGGCSVLDRLEFESRLPFIGAVLLPVYKAIFRSRHQTLKRRYG